MGIPINALFDSQGRPVDDYHGRSARQWIECADVVIALDPAIEQIAVVYGKDVAEQILNFDQRARGKRIVSVELDAHGCDELEQLCAIVELVEGYHEYQFSD